MQVLFLFFGITIVVCYLAVKVWRRRYWLQLVRETADYRTKEQAVDLLSTELVFTRKSLPEDLAKIVRSFIGDSYTLCIHCNRQFFKSAKHRQFRNTCSRACYLEQAMRHKRLHSRDGEESRIANGADRPSEYAHCDMCGDEVCVEQYELTGVCGWLCAAQKGYEWQKRLERDVELERM